MKLCGNLFTHGQQHHSQECNLFCGVWKFSFTKWFKDTEEQIFKEQSDKWLNRSRKTVKFKPLIQSQVPSSPHLCPQSIKRKSKNLHSQGFAPSAHPIYTFLLPANPTQDPRWQRCANRHLPAGRSFVFGVCVCLQNVCFPGRKAKEHVWCPCGKQFFSPTLGEFLIQFDI